MASAIDVKNGIIKNVKEAKLLTTGIRKGEVEHKYDYSALLAQTPTWGWTSTQKNVGFWMINPSFEYINGGPTQVGNTGHVEAILLNHWQDGHYGGGSLTFKQNEDWEKFVGPFFYYCNSAENNDLMWQDAIKESENQRSQWPFSWVKDKAYPKKQERGILNGQIKVNDPFVSQFSNMWVGLATTDKNWQYEGKNYQFWARADSNGHFSIPNIRAGKYTLYAFADGILGEFKKTDITITSGNKLDIGQQNWTPLRYGKPLWEIGIPNRTAAEFKHGDHYWQWGLYMLYPKEFPNDVNFTIGKSDWRKDWNYCQPAVIDDSYNVVKNTTWSINFNIPEQKKGKATLRMAICGSRRGEIINVSLNDKPIGNTGHLPEMGVMHRDGIRGKEVEINLSFDAKLLQKGSNTIKLSFNAKKWPFGILYDYLRLELDESK
jgi:rhamnogalacturonan endolyase